MATSDKPSDHPMVMVEWEDTCSRLGWHSMEEALEAETISCKSIGFLVLKNHKRIVLSQTVAGEDNQFNEVLAIPKNAVLKITRIPQP